MTEIEEDFADFRFFTWVRLLSGKNGDKSEVVRIEAAPPTCSSSCQSAKGVPYVSKHENEKEFFYLKK